MIIISDKNGQASPFRVGLSHFVGFIAMGFARVLVLGGGAPGRGFPYVR
jgi:hypothetical protein